MTEPGHLSHNLGICLSDERLPYSRTQLLIGRMTTDEVGERRAPGAHGAVGRAPRVAGPRTDTVLRYGCVLTVTVRHSRCRRASSNALSRAQVGFVSGTLPDESLALATSLVELVSYCRSVLPFLFLSLPGDIADVSSFYSDSTESEYSETGYWESSMKQVGTCITALTFLVDPSVMAPPC